LSQNDVDKFGILKIQKNTKSNNQEWYLHDDINNDKRIRLKKDPWNLKDKNKLIWEGTPVGGDQTHTCRININTTNPKAFDEKAQSDAGTNWKKLAEQGYLIGEEDFRNFELTTYFKITELEKGHDENYGKMTGYGRGGLHTSKGWPGACLATCYKGVLSIRQKTTWFEKEYHHNSGSEGYSPRLQEKKFDLIKLDVDGDKYETPWIGMKFIVYDIDAGKHAKCELWVDKNSSESINDPTKQNWIKVNELVDKGDQAGPKVDGDKLISECKCDTKNPVFAWGGPTVTWRVDQCTVQHTRTSVREFIPNTG